MSVESDLAPERETVREPAKRWRNKYFNTVTFTSDTGTFHPRGEHLGYRIFPSRDAAETVGALWEEENQPLVRLGCRYLGPFPVSENGEPL